jgi:phenylacetate-CoA ligase
MMAIPQRDALRVRRLEEALASAQRAPFYAARLRAGDLTAQPFTLREDLVADQAAAGPFGTAHTLSLEDATLIGRTGVGLSASRRRLNLLAGGLDIRREAALFGRALYEAGVRPGHRVYVAEDPRYNVMAMYAMHAVSVVGGIMVYTAAERSTRTARYVVPSLPPDHVFLPPTYARYLPRVIAERSGGRWPIRSISGWGEPGYSIPRVREDLERRWSAVSDHAPVAVVDVYGLSETGVIAIGCREGRGLHVAEDAWWLERIAIDGEGPAGAEERGEIVVTRLGRSSLPLVRYRTGDVARLDPEPCPCGRTAPRLVGIQRLLDRLGPVFPLDVEEALARAGAAVDDVRIERGPGGLVVRLAGPASALDAAALARVLERELGLAARVQVEPDAAPFLHRSYRVVDERSRDDARAELDFQHELERV